jgi:hypothetical protein
MLSGIVTLSIHRDFRHHPNVAKMVLMHEMIHIHLGLKYATGGDDSGHGMRFAAEKVRLFNEGAFDTVL